MRADEFIYKRSAVGALPCTRDSTQDSRLLRAYRVSAWLCRWSHPEATAPPRLPSIGQPQAREAQASSDLAAREAQSMATELQALKVCGWGYFGAAFRPCLCGCKDYNAGTHGHLPNPIILLPHVRGDILKGHLVGWNCCRLPPSPLDPWTCRRTWARPWAARAAWTLCPSAPWSEFRCGRVGHLQVLQPPTRRWGRSQ